MGGEVPAFTIDSEMKKYVYDDIDRAIPNMEVKGDNFTILRYPGVVQFTSLINKILIKEGVYN